MKHDWYVAIAFFACLGKVGLVAVPQSIRHKLEMKDDAA